MKTPTTPTTQSRAGCPRLLRCGGAVLAVLAAMLTLPSAAFALVDVSLNVIPLTPGNPHGGGDWTLVARTDGAHGIAAIRVVLQGVDDDAIADGGSRDDISFASGIGVLDPVATETGPRPPYLARGGDMTELLYAQDLSDSGGVVMGVGTPATRGGPDPLGDASWDDATLIASGRYSALVPSVAGARANELDQRFPPFTASSAPATSIVRVLPEPTRAASLWACGLALAALAGRRRRLGRSRSAVICALALLPWTSTAGAQQSRPNIVLIFTDDQGWTSSSVQMDPAIPESRSDFFQTPSLSRLAAEGMRFSNAYAAPMCSPARAALQFGKSPARLQMTDVTSAGRYDEGWYRLRYNGKPLTAPVQPRDLDPDEVTIAEHLKQIDPDYVTATFGKWHIHQELGPWSPEHGYDFWQTTHDSSEYPEGDPKQIFSLTDTANDFMEARVIAGEPFFLLVSHFAPHHPIEARAATIAKYQSLPPGMRHDDPAFAAMVEDLDTGIGLLLDKIDELGIEDETYVFFISDNGGVAVLGTGINAPLYHTKGSTWEGGIRVPMIVAGPGIAPGSVSDVAVSIQDFYATFSELAGSLAPLPEDLESASLVPLLENGGELPPGVSSLSRAYAPAGELFFHSPHDQLQPPGFTDRPPQSAVRDGNFKFVRIYGENGQPDAKFLFDLTEDITETEEPGSATNLIDQRPHSAALLEARLDRWLEDVDASMPFQVWDEIELRWDADQPGPDPDAWRSAVDVQHYFRETWEVEWGASNGPTRVAAAPDQPELPRHAFRFDGSQGLTRFFFHVSDNRRPDVYDADHSATFEFWLRTDDLTQEQLLFETGDSIAGLAVSIGDSDGDGDHDDVRANVRGSTDGGNSELWLATELDRFADPVDDFVQVALVVSDDDADRYLELYVNGARRGRVDGEEGPVGRLSWDDWSGMLDRAGLGMAAGRGVGGTGGTGDPPFTNGRFRGELGLVRFVNRALQPAEIRSRYNEVLHFSAFGMASLQGDVFIPAERPTDVSLGAFESAQISSLHERSGVLDASLDVDAVISGAVLLEEAGDARSGQLAAGRELSSFLLQLDPVGSAATPIAAAGSVRFKGRILGMLLEADSLTATDAELGSIGIYSEPGDRGLELGSEGTLGVSADQKTLSLDLNVMGDEMLEIRVLTEWIRESDFNADGLVDATDREIWEAAYGQNAAGDANGDGATDGLDFLEWQAQVEVPEPGATLLHLTGLAALCGLGRRRAGRRARPGRPPSASCGEAHADERWR